MWSLDCVASLYTYIREGGDGFVCLFFMLCLRVVGIFVLLVFIFFCGFNFL